MIPLSLPALAEAETPFVTRLRLADDGAEARDSVLIGEDTAGATFSGPGGLIAIDGAGPDELERDIVLVQPEAKRIERLFRRHSGHNTLLVTERCDQLCVMCSQPPKKTHHNRFSYFEEACLLAEPDTLIGVSGGEPTLYKNDLLAMIERVAAARPDLRFHVLSNGQHFEASDVDRLRQPLYRQVAWGIPLYAVTPHVHDEIVGKEGAFYRLQDSFAWLMRAGARVELRTVILQTNLAELPVLARFVSERLRFIEAWSIMQLEHIGFARNRWRDLFVRHDQEFEPIAAALDLATARGLRPQLFNFPTCSVPESYRHYAIASISDWKRKYAAACGSCSVRAQCSGFFEWHPDAEAASMVNPL